MNIKWEPVEDDSNQAGHLYRAKVPGGWLYKQVDDFPIVRPDGNIDFGIAWTSSITFAPDMPVKRALQWPGD